MLRRVALIAGNRTRASIPRHALPLQTLPSPQARTATATATLAMAAQGHYEQKWGCIGTLQLNCALGSMTTCDMKLLLNLSLNRLDFTASLLLLSWWAGSRSTHLSHRHGSITRAIRPRSKWKFLVHVDPSKNRLSRLPTVRLRLSSGSAEEINGKESKWPDKWMPDISSSPTVETYRVRVCGVFIGYFLFVGSLTASFLNHKILVSSFVSCKRTYNEQRLRTTILPK